MYAAKSSQVNVLTYQYSDGKSHVVVSCAALLLWSLHRQRNTWSLEER